MKKYVVFVTFAISLSLSSPKVMASDDLTVLECNTCYSSMHFIEKARSLTKINTEKTFLIYNIETEVLETVYSYHYYDSENRIRLADASVQPTLQSRKTDFDDFVAIKKYNIPKKINSFNMKLQGGYDGIVYNYFKPVHEHLVSNGIFSKINVFVPIVMVIQFSNGDVIIVEIPHKGSTAIELISAVDKDGKDISSRASAAGSNTGGGGPSGSSGGSSSIIITGVSVGGGSLMCSSSTKGDRMTLHCKWV